MLSLLRCVVVPLVLVSLVAPVRAEGESSDNAPYATDWGERPDTDTDPRYATSGGIADHKPELSSKPGRGFSISIPTEWVLPGMVGVGVLTLAALLGPPIYRALNSIDQVRQEQIHRATHGESIQETQRKQQQKLKRRTESKKSSKPVSNKTSFFRGWSKTHQVAQSTVRQRNRTRSTKAKQPKARLKARARM